MVTVTRTVIGTAGEDEPFIPDVASDGLVLVEGFVKDMAGSSFADMVGIKKGVHDVGGFDHLDIANEVGCTTPGWPGLGLIAHHLGRFEDEHVGAARSAPAMDNVGLFVERGD